MSRWSDMQRRAEGSDKRREDLFSQEEQIKELDNSPLKYAGSIDEDIANTIVGYKHIRGNIYSVSDTCTINGIVCEAGDILLDDGKNFVKVYKANSYIGQ